MNGLPLSVESSIGFVLAPDDGIDVDDLLQHADVAMYVAKAQHVGVVRYDADHDHYDAANLGLIADLRRAIDAGELVVHYQPKAALIDGHVDAVEALVRWQHPTLGLLYPDRFIPIVRADRPHRPAHDVGHAPGADRCPRPRERGGVGQRVSPHPRPGANFARQVIDVLERPRRAARAPHHRDHRDGAAHRPAPGPRPFWPSSTPSGSG